MVVGPDGRENLATEQVAHGRPFVRPSSPDAATRASRMATAARDAAGTVAAIAIDGETYQTFLGARHVPVHEATVAPEPEDDAVAAKLHPARPHVPPVVEVAPRVSVQAAKVAVAAPVAWSTTRLAPEVLPVAPNAGSTPADVGQLE